MTRGGTLIAVILAGLLVVPAAGAKTFEVTRVGDTLPNGCGTGGCTLREAIIAANNRDGADVIELKAGRIYSLSQAGPFENSAATGDLDVTGPLTIRSSRTRRRATVDANGIDRVFHVFARTRFSAIEIIDGSAPGMAGDEDGGGIYTLAGVGLTRSRVTANEAADLGAGIASEGGGSVTMVRSSVSGNLGEGVRQEGEGAVMLIRSRVNGNEGTGIHDFGGGAVTLVRSKVNGNGDVGVRDFDEGGIALRRSRVNGNAERGVEDFGPGGVALRRSQVNDNGSQGVQDFNEGGFRIVRSQVNGNAENGIQNFHSGTAPSLLSRSTVLGNGFRGVQNFTAGPLRITNSRIAGSADAGLRVFGGGRLSLVNSTVSGSAEGGVVIGDNAGPASIRRSTVSGNLSPDSGAGILVEGPLSIVNSTISGNRSEQSGGGIHAQGAAAVLRLNAVTVARNVADSDGSGGAFGGGLFQADPAMISVDNSLIALNRAGLPFVTGQDCYNETDPFGSGGNNLLTDSSGCTGFDAAGDLVRSNPKIGALKRNGGPTKTIALRRGSPAIGKAGSDAPNRDQRGVKRDRRPDIGAFER